MTQGVKYEKRHYRLLKAHRLRVRLSSCEISGTSSGALRSLVAELTDEEKTRVLQYIPGEKRRKENLGNIGPKAFCSMRRRAFFYP